MTDYTATILDESSQLARTEVIVADTPEQARQKLEGRGALVLDIKAPAKGLQREIPGFKKRVKLIDLAVFARIFATMSESGMNLLRTLQVLTDQTENPTLKKVLGEVTADIQAGSSLSKAIAAHPETFPPSMISGIKAGETGGFLDKALRNVAESLESDVKLRGDIKSAATYPVVVMIMAVLATIGMLLFVIPVFENMFEGLGGELPLPTRIAVALSDAMRWLAPLLLVAVVAFSWWWSSHKNDRRVREFLDPVKLKLPVFGKIILKISVARFTRNLAVMLDSGVPILEALEVAAPTSNNTVIEGVIRDAAVFVRNGRPLSEHLGDGSYIPSMVVEMVSAGEETGAMGTMLEKSADFYEQQVEAATKSLSSTLEPLLIVVLGILMGSLIVAMYLPIFKIFELIG